MEVIYILIGIALIVALIFLGLFGWAVQSGQYDDTAGPPRRMLFDEPTQEDKNKN